MTAGEKFGPPADIQGSNAPDELEAALDEDELDEELEDEEVEEVEEDDALELLELLDVEDEALDDEDVDDVVDEEDEDDPPPAPPQAANDSIKPNSSPFCFASYIVFQSPNTDCQSGSCPDGHEASVTRIQNTKKKQPAPSFNCLQLLQTQIPDSVGIHSQ